MDAQGRAAFHQAGHLSQQFLDAQINGVDAAGGARLHCAAPFGPKAAEQPQPSDARTKSILKSVTWGESKDVEVGAPTYEDTASWRKPKEKKGKRMNAEDRTNT